MMLYLRISTFSRSATTWAAELGLTWNPMTMAFDVEASSTSLSLMAPAPLWITIRRTSGVLSLSRAVLRASTLPCTSALMTTFRSWIWPSLICS